jgi:hypothetical protein
MICDSEWIYLCRASEKAFEYVYNFMAKWFFTLGVPVVVVLAIYQRLSRPAGIEIIGVIVS